MSIDLMIDGETHTARLVDLSLCGAQLQAVEMIENPDQVILVHTSLGGPITANVIQYTGDRMHVHFQIDEEQSSIVARLIDESGSRLQIPAAAEAA